MLHRSTYMPCTSRSCKNCTCLQWFWVRPTLGSFLMFVRICITMCLQVLLALTASSRIGCQKGRSERFTISLYSSSQRTSNRAPGTASSHTQMNYCCISSLHHHRCILLGSCCSIDRDLHLDHLLASNLYLFLGIRHCLLNWSRSYSWSGNYYLITVESGSCLVATNCSIGTSCYSQVACCLVDC